MKEVNGLERKISEGKRPILAYYHPPATVDLAPVQMAADLLKVADAVVVADNPGAVVHMHPLVAASVFLEKGIDTVLELECRDKNRLALQSEILGALALKIRNFLCMTGEHQTQGPQPEAKGVYDLSPVHLIQLMKIIEQGELLDGFRLGEVPSIFIGAMVNPFARPVELHFFKLLKKIKAGAKFLITTPIFALEEFKEFIKELKQRGFLEKTKVFATIMPIKSADIARVVSKDPSVHLPERICARIESVPEQNQAQEGINICVEIMKELKEMEEVSGFHIMAPHWCEVVPLLIERVGLR